MTDLKVESIAFDRLSQDQGGRWRAASVELRGTAISNDSGMAWTIASTRFGDVPLEIVLAYLGPAPALAPDLRAGPAEIRDIVGRDPVAGLRATIARSGFARVSDGAIRDSFAERIAVSLPDGSVAIARMELPSIELSARQSMTDLVEGAQAGTPAPGRAIEMLATLLATLPEVRIKGLATTSTDPSAPRIALAEFGYRTETTAKPAPFSLWVENLAVEGAPVPPAATLLAPSLAQGPLVLALRLDGRWQPDGRLLTIDPFRIGLERGAEVEIAADLGPLTPSEALSALPKEQIGTALALTPLRRATLSITDKGAIDGALTAAATAQGTTRAQLSDLVTATAARFLGEGLPADRRASIIAAIKGFIAAPGRISFAWSPRAAQALALIGAIAAQQPAALLRDAEVSYTPPVK